MAMSPFLSTRILLVLTIPLSTACGKVRGELGAPEEGLASRVAIRTDDVPGNHAQEGNKGSAAAPDAPDAPDAPRNTPACTTPASSVAAAPAPSVFLALPETFDHHCASCHGPEGLGHGPFPGLLGVPSTGFKAVVRSGRGVMPAFPVSSLSDEELASIAAYFESASRPPAATTAPGATVPCALVDTPPVAPTVPPLVETRTAPAAGGHVSEALFPSGAAVPVASEPKLCFSKGSEVQPGPWPASYVNSCAGCHGTEGVGRGEFPSLAGLPLDRIRTVVRAGAGNKMPAFSSQWISDGDLLRVAANVQGRAISAEAESDCTLPPAAIESAASRQDVLARGIAALRKPDLHGRACANCHAPDAFDLAYVGYDEGTIIRRALLHVGSEDAKAIARLVAQHRVEYAIPARDPMAFRPFQPGGVPLACGTAAECDHAFGLALLDAAPALKRPIDTLDDARSARDQLLAINPRTFRIGFALNRWTEDGFRGMPHGSASEWIPNFAMLPKSDEAKRRIHQAQDAYLASPDWTTLGALLTTVNADTSMEAEANTWSNIYKDKFRSVLVASHLFRLEHTKKEFFSHMPAVLRPELKNPFWMTGDGARMEMAGCYSGLPADCRRPPQLVIDETAARGLTPSSELSSIRMSWFWAGFFFDQTLYRTPGGAAPSSEYFTGHLYQLRYYNHLTYMRFMKNFAIAYRPGGDVSGTGERQLASWRAQNWHYFLGYGKGFDEKAMPPAGEKRELYKSLLANLMRMNYWLIFDEATNLGKVDGKANVLELGETSLHGRFLFEVADVGDAARAARDRELIVRAMAAVQAACENRALVYKEVAPVGHCKYGK